MQNNKIQSQLCKNVHGIKATKNVYQSSNEWLPLGVVIICDFFSCIFITLCTLHFENLLIFLLQERI